MPATPTPWGGFRLPAEGDLPDVPTDMSHLGNDIDALLKLIMGGTVAPTTAQNLLNVNAQISGLTSAQSTQAGQISTLQGQVAGLSHLPYAYSVQFNGTITFPGGSAGATPTTVQSITVPAQAYRRVLLVYGSATWEWLFDRSTSPLMQKLKLGGVERSTSIMSGADVTLSGFFMETVESGVAVTITQTIEAPEPWETDATITVSNSYAPPRMYAVALPWGGSVVPPPS